jgi:predicted transposase/invertase (TIGR01784 family)
MYLTPLSNYVLLKLFTSEENKPLLLLFLNSILSAGERLKEVRLDNKNKDKKTQRKRAFMPDIKSREETYCMPEIKGIDEKGRECHIEMEVSEEMYYNKQDLYNWTWLINNQRLKEGRDYSFKEKTIKIIIMNADCFEKERNYHNVFHVLNTDSSDNVKHIEHIEYHFIEILKFINNVKEPQSKLDYWIKFFTMVHKCEKENLPEIIKTNFELKATFEALERMCTSFTLEDGAIYNEEVKRLNRERGTIITAYCNGMRDVLTHLINRKFGAIPKEFLSLIEELEERRISNLSEDILEGKSLKELYRLGLTYKIEDGKNKVKSLEEWSNEVESKMSSSIESEGSGYIDRITVRVRKCNTE